jgi:hypothetical protein
LTPLSARPGPFDGEQFRGRIAFSSNGNYSDEDDWGAFPAAMAILDALRIGRQILRDNALNPFPSLRERLWRK